MTIDGAAAVKVLFERFDAAVKAFSYLAMDGQIVDVTIVAAPEQRNTQAEKDVIKQSRIPEDWKAQAGEARTKGSRCALDDEVHQGQAA